MFNLMCGMLMNGIFEQKKALYMGQKRTDCTCCPKKARLIFL